MVAAVLSGCGGGAQHHASHWDGRRGYDGRGDHGYDLGASRAGARGYRAAAARAHPAPGAPDDPWGPHISEAAARFRVPERWVREVVRRESGGRARGADGLPVTSPAGAVGLTRVMPRTCDAPRRRHGPGADPHEPRDNIQAGAAHIREMHDRHGAPGFLAACNAGPDRVDAVLPGATVLPDETVDHLASAAPRPGTGVAMSGPFVAYAGGAAASGCSSAFAPGADRAYAGGGMAGTDYYASAFSAAPAADDPSLRAFDGGGLVTPDAPTGSLTARPRL